MEDDMLLPSDPKGLYTRGQIIAILERARQQGHPLERGSYLEKMTIGQLDRLTKEATDA